MPTNKGNPLMKGGSIHKNRKKKSSGHASAHGGNPLRPKSKKMKSRKKK